mmetsp:Transcript_85947/g.134394  ORF Transcript_85947/g.134394 Transcript_85947/m.134394 type:complete len:99 (-) Transcript_85947:40-336(-)
MMASTCLDKGHFLVAEYSVLCNCWQWGTLAQTHAPPPAQSVLNQIWTSPGFKSVPSGNGISDLHLDFNVLAVCGLPAPRQSCDQWLCQANMYFICTYM